MLKEIVQWVLALFGSGKERKAHEVGKHARRQAYGPGWSKRKRIKIDPYRRRR